MIEISSIEACDRDEAVLIQSASEDSAQSCHWQAA